MNVNITTTPFFERLLKRYVRKFPSLKPELNILYNTLLQNPEFGTDLGHGIHKIRLAVKSKGKGKRGGFRLITYINIIVFQTDYEVYMAVIYDKNEFNEISKKEIIEILKESGIVI
jgi:hypothetical protein